MIKLLYRGKHYIQHKYVIQKNSVDLIYRQAIYKSRKKASCPSPNPLIYRGNQYYSRNQPLVMPELKGFNTQYEVFNLARKIIHAQFELADESLTNDLWDEVFKKKIDHERIINLIYSHFDEDDEELLRQVDFAYLST